MIKMKNIPSIQVSNTQSLQKPINRSKKKPPSIVLSSLVHPLR
nr:MAG TPA: hypothetical protein [Caudoviricetes sp.]